MSLKNKIAIISGASRGIGRAIALELAKEGADISFNYLKSVVEAQGLENELKSLGVKTKAFKVDIGDYGAVSEWVKETKELFGGLDIVINNAGIIKDMALMFMEKKDWQDVIDTNLGGVFNLTRAAITGFMKQKSGNIINISSVSGIIGVAKQTNYAASKAGVIGFTKSVAQELGSRSIRCNAVAPGFIETEMTGKLPEDVKESWIKEIPLKRAGKPEDVADLCVFLGSDMSSYISGQVLNVCGGMQM